MPGYRVRYSFPTTISASGVSSLIARTALCNTLIAFGDQTSDCQARVMFAASRGLFTVTYVLYRLFGLLGRLEGPLMPLFVAQGYANPAIRTSQTWTHQTSAHFPKLPHQHCVAS